jgi:hypothetical protein
MPNILDVDESFLHAKAQVTEWAEEFLAKWTEPIDEMRLLLWWVSQPPAIHEQLKAMAPEEHARLQARVEETIKRKERTNGRQ